jgi:hypothetical protein
MTEAERERLDAEALNQAETLKQAEAPVAKTDGEIVASKDPMAKTFLKLIRDAHIRRTLKAGGTVDLGGPARLSRREARPAGFAAKADRSHYVDQEIGAVPSALGGWPAHVLVGLSAAFPEAVREVILPRRPVRG